MTDFATTAKQILTKRLKWRFLDPDGSTLAALVKAHEADKREAVREELETMQQIDFSDDYEPGELHGVTLDEYLASRLAALAGSEKPVTPPTTPRRHNAPSDRTAGSYVTDVLHSGNGFDVLYPAPPKPKKRVRGITDDRSVVTELKRLKAEIKRLGFDESDSPIMAINDRIKSLTPNAAGRP